MIITLTDEGESWRASVGRLFLLLLLGVEAVVHCPRFPVRSEVIIPLDVTELGMDGSPPKSFPVNCLQEREREPSSLKKMPPSPEAAHF